MLNVDDVTPPPAPYPIIYASSFLLDVIERYMHLLKVKMLKGHSTPSPTPRWHIFKFKFKFKYKIKFIVYLQIYVKDLLVSCTQTGYILPDNK